MKLEATQLLPSRAPLGLRLHVGVIGGLSLSIGDTPLGLNLRRARLILAYLALNHGRPVARERLVGLLWSSSERQSRGAFRTELYELNRLLASLGYPGLERMGNDLGLAHGSFTVDLTEALEAISAGHVPASLMIQPQACGQILAGFEDVSEGLRAWIEEVRAAAGVSLRSAINGAIASPSLPRRSRRAMAELAMRVDPLDEAACRSAMRLAAEDGEIGAALRAYGALYEALGADLDMEPSEETLALVAAIKTGVPHGSLASRQPPPKAVPVPGDPLRGIPVVAMLPLHIAGDEVHAGWIAEAVVEDTVRILAGLREMAVISSNSTRQLRSPEPDMAATADRLGADYLLSGSLRLVGNRGRLHMELCVPRNGAVLWADVHHFAVEDLFQAHERIAARVANAVAPNVGAAELRLSLSHPPANLGAYHLLLRARHLMARLDRSAFDEAGGLLTEAVGRDPASAGAHATLAAWYGLRFGQYWSPDEAADSRQLILSARTAIDLDPHHARALALLGHHTMLTEQRHDDAAALLDRAVTAAPNDAEVLLWASPTAAYVGREADAIDRASRAMALSPVDPFRFRFAHFLSLAHYTAGDFAQAAEWGLHAWQLNPNYTSNLGITAAALAALDRQEEAAPLVERYCAARPGFRASHVITANSYRQPAQRRQLAELLVKAGVPR